MVLAVDSFLAVDPADSVSASRVGLRRVSFGEYFCWWSESIQAVWLSKGGFLAESELRIKCLS